MTPWEPIAFFKTCGDATRLRCLLLLLAQEELCVGELGYALNVVQPKISRHLAAMRSARMVQDRRQGTWIYYKIHPQLPGWMRQTLESVGELMNNHPGFLRDMARLQAVPERLRQPTGMDLFSHAQEPLEPSIPMEPEEEPEVRMAEESAPDDWSDMGDVIGQRPLRVLFLSRRNTARGILAEAIFNQFGKDRLHAYSGGIVPATEFHPVVTELLHALELTTVVPHCQGWEVFNRPEAPELDMICHLWDPDEAPLDLPWLHQPPVVVWQLPDPFTAQWRYGSAMGRMPAFQQILRQLMQQVRRVLALPLEGMDLVAIQREWQGIASLEIGKQ